MDKTEFERLHFCTFERDPARVELDKAFDEYYSKSEKLNNAQARVLWGDLRSYANDMGFSNKEFQDAKMRASGRIR